MIPPTNAKYQDQQINENLIDNEDYTDDFEQQPYDMGLPINTDIALDNKIVSSHAKNKIILFSPQFKEEIIAIPLLDDKNKIMTKKLKIGGEIKEVPIISKIKTMRYLTGFGVEEHDFPITDWFNDSVTSSILEKENARYIRTIDDLGYLLMTKMVQDPERIRIIGFLQRLYAHKMSLADTAKGIGGGAVEQVKTQTRKSESQSVLYRQDKEELDNYRNRSDSAKKGLLGINLPIIGTI